MLNRVGMAQLAQGASGLPAVPPWEACSRFDALDALTLGIVAASLADLVDIEDTDDTDDTEDVDPGSEPMHGTPQVAPVSDELSVLPAPPREVTPPASSQAPPAPVVASTVEESPVESVPSPVETTPWVPPSAARPTVHTPESAPEAPRLAGAFFAAVPWQDNVLTMPVSNRSQPENAPGRGAQYAAPYFRSLPWGGAGDPAATAGGVPSGGSFLDFATRAAVRASGGTLPPDSLATPPVSTGAAAWFHQLPWTGDAR